MGKRFEMRTDHNGLKYLFDQPTLNASQRRWLEFLSEYDFDIKHIKGKENKVVDALSKRVHELHATTISMYQNDIKRKILEVANADLQYRELVAMLQQGKMLQKVDDYKLGIDGIFLRKNNIFLISWVHNIWHIMHFSQYHIFQFLRICYINYFPVYENFIIFQLIVFNFLLQNTLL